MKVFIIVPTYNEKENIGPFLEALGTEFKKIENHEMNVLVVDGQSPDGTGEVVQALSKDNPHLYLLSTPKGGIGADYLKAMRYAISELKAEVIFEMDADFQHDPRYLPDFLAAIDDGYDYVLGSRFIKGGSIPADWGIHRKFLSRFGNLFARLILWHPNIHDLTTGYKASRVKGFLDKIDLSKILSKSYAYKIHLLEEMMGVGAKVKEVPISFLTRERGSSKMDIEDFFESLRVVILLRLRKSRRLVKMILVGSFGLILQTLVFNFLLRLHFDPAFSAVLGGEIAIISNFTFNNLWTFREVRLGLRRVPFKLLQFNLTSLGALAIQWSIVKAGTTAFGVGVKSANIFFLISLFPVLVWNFSFYSRVVWRKK